MSVLLQLARCFGVDVCVPAEEEAASSEGTPSTAAPVHGSPVPKAIALFYSLLVTLGPGIIIGEPSRKSAEWYKTLSRPRFYPGPVWHCRVVFMFSACSIACIYSTLRADGGAAYAHCSSKFAAWLSKQRLAGADAVLSSAAALQQRGVVAAQREPKSDVVASPVSVSGSTVFAEDAAGAGSPVGSEPADSIVGAAPHSDTDGTATDDEMFRRAVARVRRENILRADTPIAAPPAPGAPLTSSIDATPISLAGRIRCATRCTFRVVRGLAQWLVCYSPHESICASRVSAPCRAISRAEYLAAFESRRVLVVRTIVLHTMPMRVILMSLMFRLRFRHPRLTVAVFILQTLCTWSLTARAYSVDRFAGTMMLPVCLWLPIMSCLKMQLYWMNRISIAACRSLP